MRLGCGGCLGSLIFIGVLGAGVLAAVWVAGRFTAAPDQAPAVGTERDGVRAQQTLFEIMRRSSARRPPAQRTRTEHVLSEAELNAFISRHLGRVAGLSLRDPSVRLIGGGVVEVRGQLDLDELTEDRVAGLVGYLPESWRTAAVTLTLRGPVRLETEAARGQAKSLRFDIQAAYVGRQAVPVFALERVLATTERLRRWSVPDSVTAVIVESGRVVIQTES